MPADRRGFRKSRAFYQPPGQDARGLSGGSRAPAGVSRAASSGESGWRRRRRTERSPAPGRRSGSRPAQRPCMAAKGHTSASASRSTMSVPGQRRSTASSADPSPRAGPCGCRESEPCCIMLSPCRAVWRANSPQARRRRRRSSPAIANAARRRARRDRPGHAPAPSSTDHARAAPAISSGWPAPRRRRCKSSANGPRRRRFQGGESQVACDAADGAGRSLTGRWRSPNVNKQRT